MAEFDHFMVKIIDRYFSFLEEGSYSSQTALIEVSRVKIGLAVLAAPSSKSVKRLKKEKKNEPLYVEYMYLQPGKFSRNQFLLDYPGWWHNQFAKYFLNRLTRMSLARG